MKMVSYVSGHRYIPLVQFKAAVGGALIEIRNTRKKGKTFYKFKHTSTSKKEKMNPPFPELCFDNLHHYPLHKEQGATASRCLDQRYCEDTK